MSPEQGQRVHCLRALPDVPAAERVQVQVPARPGLERRQAGAAITDAVVRLVRAHAGRGPTKGKTSLSADLAIVTLGGWLVPAERTLISQGQADLATKVRTALHQGMRTEAVAAVEQITGRRVAAYLTSHQMHSPELAIIAFHLSPDARLNGH